MSNRRDFLKTTLIIASGITIARAAHAQNSNQNLPFGLIYTQENPGIWAKKVGSHAALVSHKDGKIEIFTKHGMSEKHYIVRHTLVTANGEVLGSKTFYPSDEEARSNYSLPATVKGPLYATSFCNKHDFWVTAFEI